MIFWGELYNREKKSKRMVCLGLNFNFNFSVHFRVKLLLSGQSESNFSSSEVVRLNYNPDFFRLN